MESMEYIFGHGSGNKFVMFDTIANSMPLLYEQEFIINVCRNTLSDGVLLLVRYDDEHLGMRMFNTDGTEAEMCGNGIRLVARLADERYLHSECFTLYSGGKPYPIRRQADISPDVVTYSVDIAISLLSPDFDSSRQHTLVGKVIDRLDSDLRFTYLNLGNPHLVAQCDDIDLDKLTVMGEKMKCGAMRNALPNGCNISLYKVLSPQQIFVATYERGVGLTASCGTAMTASCSAAVLLGLCRMGENVDVRNRGGAVRCRTAIDPKITTRLSGNASYIAYGELDASGEILTREECYDEQEAWQEFLHELGV